MEAGSEKGVDLLVEVEKCSVVFRYRSMTHTQPEFLRCPLIFQLNLIEGKNSLVRVTVTLYKETSRTNLI